MTRSILGQAIPAANALIDLYTVPIKSRATIFTILITNQSGTSSTFKLAIAVNGIADTPKQYWFYNANIEAYETIDLDIQPTIETATKIRVSSSSGNISFNVVGSEVPVV